jgi:hypothetical protein
MKPVVVKGAAIPAKKPAASGAPGSPAKDSSASPPRPQAQKQKSIFKRIAEIVSDDIQFRIHGIRSKDREKWEDYKKFCELSRGKG